jgi:pyruvate dehydrogenase E1 component alpha subunit
MALSDTQLLELYRWIVMERLFDEKINSLFRMGKIMSMFHSVLGHEAVTVGAAYALRAGDAFIPYHRGKVIYPMRGMGLNHFVAGLFGKKEGFGQGRSPVGSHMCGDPTIGLLPSVGCIGSPLVVGVGAALAIKLGHRGNAALVCIGDAGSNRGDVHEGMNFAAVLKLPVVFLFINNGWGLSVPTSLSTSVNQISERAAAYRMPGITIDGRDLLTVHETVSEALERARGGGGPSLVEATVTRWTAHSVNDPDIYRTDSEREEARKVDPVAEYEILLRNRGLLGAERIQEIRTECNATLDAAITYAESCTEPDMACLVSGVYKAEA